MNFSNPFGVVIDDAENILTALGSAARRLEAAIENEAIARAQARDAAETLAAAVDEAVLVEVMLAQSKEGPLAGIATTSDAYKVAFRARVQAHTTGPELAHLHGDANRLRIAADNAKIELDQAQVQFAACKHAADLKAQILRASIA